MRGVVSNAQLKQALMRDNRRELPLHFLASRALEKFLQRGYGCDHRPRCDCCDDDKKQRFDGKFQVAFAGEITSGQFAK